MVADNIVIRGGACLMAITNAMSDNAIKAPPKLKVAWTSVDTNRIQSTAIKVLIDISLAYQAQEFPQEKSSSDLVVDQHGFPIRKRIEGLCYAETILFLWENPWRSAQIFRDP